MTEPAPTAAHPAGFGRARVLVLGDVMLDRYVYGAVERVSYAAPIPVLAVRREEAMPGGAGNVAGLGATAILIGLVGEDAAGATLAGLPRARAGDDIEDALYRRQPAIAARRPGDDGSGGGRARRGATRGTGGGAAAGRRARAFRLCQGRQGMSLI